MESCTAIKVDVEHPVTCDSPTARSCVSCDFPTSCPLEPNHDLDHVDILLPSIKPNIKEILNISNSGAELKQLGGWVLLLSPPPPPLSTLDCSRPTTGYVVLGQAGCL
jgi:hypothetical protein